MEVNYIVNRIDEQGNSKKAAWLENYVKHSVKSKGVGIPQIREIVIDAAKKFDINTKPIPEQIDILNNLMKQEYTEHKIAAIIYIQLFLKDYSHEIIKPISHWFDNGYIKDWNVCDWLCVRILSPMIDSSPDLIIPELEQWNKNENLWKARASLVPFAQCKNISAHWNHINKFSQVLIKRDERFCKTSVGWVMREYSKKDKSLVADFLVKHSKYTTKEVVSNATKYFN